MHRSPWKRNNNIKTGPYALSDNLIGLEKKKKIAKS